ncbi:transposase [Siphonobacter sp. SORGH_AS_0500]
MSKHRSHSFEFKLRCVKEVLEGRESMTRVAHRQGISPTFSQAMVLLP